MYQQIFFEKLDSFREEYLADKEYIAFVAIALAALVLYYIGEKILFATSASYRRSVFRQQVIDEIERKAQLDKETKINRMINNKETQYLYS